MSTARAYLTKVRYGNAVPIPPLIPIAHEDDYRTDRIGRYEDGLFLRTHGITTPTCTSSTTMALYRESTIVSVPDRSMVEQTLDGLLAALRGKVYCDIAVQLFQAEYEGVLFGLIDESGDRAGDGGHTDWVELYPDRLGFSHPWDGFYST